MSTLWSFRIHLFPSHFAIWVMESERSVIRGKDGECAVCETSPDRLLVERAFTRGRTADTFCTLKVFSFHIRSSKIQILRTCLSMNWDITSLRVADMLHGRLLLAEADIENTGAET